MKQTVVKDRSPPDSDLVFLVAWERLLWQSTRTLCVCVCESADTEPPRNAEHCLPHVVDECIIHIRLPTTPTFPPDHTLKHNSS